MSAEFLLEIGTEELPSSFVRHALRSMHESATELIGQARLATGDRPGARQSLGTSVVSGLAFATLLIIMVPVFYYVLQRAREGWSKTRGETAPGKAIPEAAPGSD